MSVAALVLGILCILCGVVYIPFDFIIGPIAAILATILGVKGRKNAMYTGEGKGLATAGLVMGIIGDVFVAADVICALACAGVIASL